MVGGVGESRGVRGVGNRRAGRKEKKMAAWVTFKSGIVAKYNRCSFVEHGKDYALRTKVNGDTIAIIPAENIERFEYERPCRTYRQPRKDKLPIIK